MDELSLRMVLIEIPKLPEKSVEAPVGTDPLGLNECQVFVMEAAVAEVVGAAATMLKSTLELMSVEYII